MDQIEAGSWPVGEVTFHYRRIPESSTENEYVYAIYTEDGYESYRTVAFDDEGVMVQVLRAQIESIGARYVAGSVWRP